MRTKYNKLGLSTAISLIFIAFMQIGDANAQGGINKYSDPVIREIHELADHRDSLALLTYLRDSNPIYQGEALMCFGSVQAPSLNDSIALALGSEMNGVRMAAAFALGQSFDSGAVSHIKSALEKDTVKLVKGMLFDALGKTGDEFDLRWMAVQKADYQETEGLVQGILRFGMRGITLPEGNDRLLDLMKEGTSSVGLMYASYHLGRYADTVWLEQNIEELEKFYRNEIDPVIGANLLTGIIKGRGVDAGPAIEIILNSDGDYREKVNTMKAVDQKSWDGASKMIFNLTSDADPNLAVAAAESIVKNSGPDNLRDLQKALKKVLNWRARALILGKALELTEDDKDKLVLVNQNSELYANSNNSIEKAFLLKCFASTPEKYSFVEQAMKSQVIVIRTYAMETLTLMARHKNYKQAKDVISANGGDLDAEFFRIFKTAIVSNDIALVSMAAGMFREQKLDYKNKISDYSFLEKALEDAQAPELVEAKNELQSTLSYLTGKEYATDPGPSYNHPIDWGRVMSVNPRQMVGISTSKGEVVVQLNVNWCPGTVSAFLEMLDSGFYNNKAIHRVVPNFVVQDGCPRGDGWGGPPFTIRSEFTPAPFLEGTLGMASAGKDTEGSQWYFTHTATPHLDGKYSNFGRVVEGIEVVHQLEVGDIIKRVVLIR